ncbi:MAG TPA: cbb3-type cytochrome c oxidase subunit I, partial [Polyangiaceae bacterium]|nr:cbb3-type cytochrome c oxidase subunit I [Polyangiaceae bacterium]
MTAPAVVHPEARDVEARWFEWAGTVDHKRIGILYLVTALFYFVVAGCEALVVRLQLAEPRGRLLTPEAYNELFTMHGVTMIFLVVMPALTGFANYFVPLMIGARDVAFPRLNLLSWYVFMFGGIFAVGSILVGGVDTGWTFYTPYSSTYSNGWVIAMA